METNKISRFAPLKNVSALLGLVNRLSDRNIDLPGLGVFHGPAGFGKTKAMIYVGNKTGAAVVSIGDSWTRRKFLQHVLRELGEVNPKGTVADMAEQAIALLGDRVERPLIIDEADKAIDKGLIELIRELHDYSQAPVILIGEEKLPLKLQAIERVHSRVLDWLPAQECDLEDARHLAQAYAPQLVIADDLLADIRQRSRGIARYIANNIDGMVEFARREGLKELDLGTYQGRVFTGSPPRRDKRAA
jgi:DNA transposition AAA+ family ATPase